MLRLTLVVALALVAPTSGAANPATATAIPPPYKNCTQLNKKYPHGVGKVGARDKTKSKTAKPVTTFKRNTKIYNTAMKRNKRLDADKDGVACEKA